MEDYKEFYTALKAMHVAAMRLDKPYRQAADKCFDELAALLFEDNVIEGRVA